MRDSSGPSSAGHIQSMIPSHPCSPLTSLGGSRSQSTGYPSEAPADGTYEMQSLHPRDSRWQHPNQSRGFSMSVRKSNSLQLRKQWVFTELLRNVWGAGVGGKVGEEATSRDGLEDTVPPPRPQPRTSGGSNCHLPMKCMSRRRRLARVTATACGQCCRACSQCLLL